MEAAERNQYCWQPNDIGVGRVPACDVEAVEMKVLQVQAVTFTGFSINSCLWLFQLTLSKVCTVRSLSVMFHLFTV